MIDRRWLWGALLAALPVAAEAAQRRKARRAPESREGDDQFASTEHRLHDLERKVEELERWNELLKSVVREIASERDRT